MARNTGTIIQNNLSRGIVTEATGLNFPENAATDGLNVRFNRTGSVERRKGIDVEGSATTIAYDEGDGVLQEFLWKSVSKVGGVTFLVMQIGLEVHFYELTQSESLSTGISPAVLSLRDYLAPGASRPEAIPCTFASGAGYLYIAHPMCDPVYIEYDNEASAFIPHRITIKVRDHLGIEEPLEDDVEPSTLSSIHHYNLKNQGWYKDVRVGTVTNEV